MAMTGTEGLTKKLNKAKNKMRCNSLESESEKQNNKKKI
jgi:hypothetical protein